MSRKFLILPLIAAVLATSAMLAPATAQKTTPTTNVANLNSSRSNIYKVTAVDAKAKTFTGIDKAGKTFTFTAPKGKSLPKVGKIYDVAYTESPGGGPLQAVTVKGTKSNSSE